MRLPFFYGWVVVAVAFVTMGIGVNVRTAFSLLFPPIVEEFGWDRGLTAGAFSVGFVTSTLYAPFLGRLMDRYGPRLIIPTAIAVVSGGLLLATEITRPWHLHLSLGVLVVGASITMAYIGHSLFLPYWFVRRRGLAIGIAFSGVGVGSIVLFPWLQGLIDAFGWRDGCRAMAALLVVTLLPLNVLLQRHKPQDMGLRPDGDAAPGAAGARGTSAADGVVDAGWVGTDWTLPRAMRTARFWWLAAAFFTGLFAWYAVQVHQTKYLIETGFGATRAAFALGFVGFAGIFGQIAIGHLSDRIGREWAWTLSLFGFVLCYALLLALGRYPWPALMYAMAAAQGLLGYGLASGFGAIPAELFAGRRYGTIFGVLSLFSGLGAAAGPWFTGMVHDRTGSYDPAFWTAIVLSGLSILCIWRSAPRKVRLVAGQAARRRPAGPDQRVGTGTSPE